MIYERGPGARTVALKRTGFRPPQTQLTFRCMHTNCDSNGPFIVAFEVMYHTVPLKGSASQKLCHRFPYNRV